MFKVFFASTVLVLLIFCKGTSCSLLTSTCSEISGQLPPFGKEESLKAKYTIIKSVPEQLHNVELPDLDDVLQELGMLEK